MQSSFVLSREYFCRVETNTRENHQMSLAQIGLWPKHAQHGPRKQQKGETAGSRAAAEEAAVNCKQPDMMCSMWTIFSTAAASAKSAAWTAPYKWAHYLATHQEQQLHNASIYYRLTCNVKKRRVNTQLGLFSDSTCLIKYDSLKQCWKILDRNKPASNWAWREGRFQLLTLFLLSLLLLFNLVFSIKIVSSHWEGG